MKYSDVLIAAKKNIGPHCKVCPQCNGIACQGKIPGPGGKGTGTGFIRNYKAFKSVAINMDTLNTYHAPDTRMELFGMTFDMPIFAAPVGGVQIHYSDLHDDLTYSEAILLGSINAGSIGFTGDGVMAEVYDGTAEAILKYKGLGVPTIKPWRKEEIMEKIKIAENAGAKAIAMDIDAAGLTMLAVQGKPVFPVGFETLSELIASTKLPFIIKGIMTVAGAIKAVDAGAYGIVVSNHGGRVLDDTPATLDVLPEILQAVEGRVKVFIDGGIRTGLDVFKALAMGADAVLIGRPFASAVYGGGAEGVTLLYQQLKSELENVMLMTGCSKLEDIGPEHIRKI
jgi:isopentenyl diphosphate isomerase/L-lactate dehydrogenase-like FMN-dependent dehydrogenase